MTLDEFLIEAGQHGLYAVDHDIEDFKRELGAMDKLLRANPASRPRLKQARRSLSRAATQGRHRRGRRAPRGGHRRSGDERKNDRDCYEDRRVVHVDRKGKCFDEPREPPRSAETYGKACTSELIEILRAT